MRSLTFRTPSIPSSLFFIFLIISVLVGQAVPAPTDTELDHAHQKRDADADRDLRNEYSSQALVDRDASPDASLPDHDDDYDEYDDNEYSDSSTTLLSTVKRSLTTPLTHLLHPLTPRAIPTGAKAGSRPRTSPRHRLPPKTSSTRSKPKAHRTRPKPPNKPQHIPIPIPHPHPKHILISTPPSDIPIPPLEHPPEKKDGPAPALPFMHRKGKTGVKPKGGHKKTPSTPKKVNVRPIRGGATTTSGDPLGGGKKPARPTAPPRAKY